MNVKELDEFPARARRRVALVMVLAVAGCGGGGPGPAPHATPTATTSPDAATTSTQGSRPLSRDTSRTAAGIASDRNVCSLLHAGEVARTVAAVTGRRPRLHAAANDSFELSICRYGGRGATVRAVLDGATDATRRYYNMQTEATQLAKVFGGGRSDFRLVWDVGDDKTYGGAGAFWRPSRQQLVAIHADRIVRVAVSAAGAADRQRRIVASRLARRVLVRADR